MSDIFVCEHKIWRDGQDGEPGRYYEIGERVDGALWPPEVVETLVKVGALRPARHELDRVTGIGPQWRKALYSAGIWTLAQLVEANEVALEARIGGVTVEQVEGWQAEALELLEADFEADSAEFELAPADFGSEGDLEGSEGSE